MVVLVRCSNNTYSVAMKSRLNNLVADGVVTAVLRNGEWIALNREERQYSRSLKRKSVSLAATLSP